ncbi:MAG: hypothetical protein M1839_002701 [Geoglossum umbratile]|nr:MAG: hypothetical protein M1839_002701 [Geoglossum umbratile]
MEKSYLVEHQGMREWYRSGNESPTIEAAKEVLSTQSEFERGFRLKATKQEVECLKISTLSDLEGQLRGRMKDLKTTKTTWRGNRRVVSVKLQRFLTRMSEFLECYSGIVEILRCADMQYGGVAYGTISALLIVAVNKERKEEKIEEALENIQANLPRMKTTQEIYPSENMERLVAEVYKEVILFLRKSTMYYLQPGYSRFFQARPAGLMRFWQAITQPPKMGFDMSVDEIGRKITEVKEERDINLNLREWADLRLEFQASKKHNEKKFTGEASPMAILEHVLALKRADTSSHIHEDVSEIHSEEAKARLHSIRPLLVNTQYDSDGYRSSYRLTLAEIFGQTSETQTSELMKKDAYSRWRTSERSCLLQISGETNTRATGLCWLSPLVLHVIDMLNRDDQHAVYHFCQRQNSMPENVLVYEVLSGIVYQLLALRPSTLGNRDRFEALASKLKSDDWRSESLTNVFKVLTDIFVMLTELFEKLGTVYILLDRVDRCSGSTQRLIEKLLELLTVGDTYRVKILVVVSMCRVGQDEIEAPDEYIKGGNYVEISGWDEPFSSPARKSPLRPKKGRRKS